MRFQTELRSWFDKHRRKWPVAVALVVWVIDGLTSNWVIDTLVPFLFAQATRLTKVTVGWFGLVFFLSVLWGSLERNPRVVAALERRRAGHDRKKKGSGTSPLTPEEAFEVEFVYGVWRKSGHEASNALAQMLDHLADEYSYNNRFVALLRHQWQDLR